MSNVIPLAALDHRVGRGRVFGVREEDVLRHVLVVGKTGSGKSALLERFVVSDLRAGRGLALLDPHGDLVTRVLDLVPRRRVNDVALFDPADLEHPVGLDLLSSASPDGRARVVSGVVGAFRKAFVDSWGPRLEHCFRNALFALLEVRGTTLLGVPRILLEERYRAWVVRQVRDPLVRHFWLVEYPSYGKALAAEAAAPVLNKVAAALSSSAVRNVVGQASARLDLRALMDRQGVLLADLSKGRIGESGSALLGALLLAQLQSATYGRVELPPERRTPFHLYVDEVGSFATRALGELLAEARKFGLGVVLACQFLGQMDEDLRRAVIGNAGTLVCFRLGAEDARVLADELAPTFTPTDLIALDRFQVALRLSVDGVTSSPFTAVTLPPHGDDERTGSTDAIRHASRQRFGRPRAEVERRVREQLELLGDPRVLWTSEP